MDTPQSQQEYLDVQHKNILGFDKMMPSVQEKADQKFLEQLHNHPASAGKIVDAARMNENRFRTDSPSRGFA